ncbi:type II toxin-antitoxin system VapC family toxin [Candidatus Uhrbacteria bacterium]|nr:type II toxin-antitoxin system VapC family toxin [Candidatus Uhrbacteria bacterium]
MNNTWIIDSSFALCFLLPDEHSKEVDDMFELYAQGERKLCSSPLLFFEVYNGLASAVRRKRIDQKKAAELMNLFHTLKIPTIECEYALSLDLAFEYSLSFYDATYVALAKANKLPLLTLDSKLKEIFSR